MKKKTRENIMSIILSVISLTYFCTFLFLNATPAKLAMSSDTANVGIISKIFWENGSLFSENYEPYTESGVFAAPVIGALIYGITKNLWLAQCIPIIILVFGMLISFIYMLSGIESLSRQDIAFGVCMLLAFPPGWYQQYTTFLFCGGYAICISVLFFLLGDLGRLLQGKLKHKAGHYLIHLILALLQGLNASRGVLMIYVPLVLMVLFRYVTRVFREKKIWVKEEFGYLIYAGILFCTSYLATYTPVSVRTTGDFSRSGALGRLLYLIFPAILRELGVDGRTNLFLMITALVFGGLTCFVGLYLIFKYKVKDGLENVVLFMLIDLSLTVFMCMIMANYEGSQRYFVVVYYLIIFALIYFYKRCNYKSLSKFVIMFILVIYSVINMFSTYVPLVKEGMNFSRRGEEYEIIDWMIERDYYYGYAHYLDANALTILADGEVQISAIQVENLNMAGFVTDHRWYTPNLPEDMETVYIFRKSDTERIGSNVDCDISNVQVMEVYETANYYIYVLDKNLSSSQ